MTTTGGVPVNVEIAYSDRNETLPIYAVKFIYRVLGLTDRKTYGIILTKLGPKWVYTIEEQGKAECAE